MKVGLKTKFKEIDDNMETIVSILEDFEQRLSGLEAAAEALRTEAASLVYQEAMQLQEALGKFRGKIDPRRAA